MIKPEGREISYLLGSKNQLVIPDYQREYEWNKVEGEELFYDVTSREEGMPLFIGTFIINKGKDVKEFEIVDGQQRITTILVLLIACRVYATEKQFEKGVVGNTQESIAIKDNNPAKVVKCRLQTSGNVGCPLNIMSQPDWDGKYEESMGKRYGWNRINKAYNFFQNELRTENYTQDAIGKLVKAILDINYVEIMVSNPVEAIYTFEVVNARGKRLAVYDLMKAYLFGRAENGELDIENTKKDWDEIKKTVNGQDSKLTKMLYLFGFSKDGYVPPAQRFRNLKSRAEKSPQKFVNELKIFAKFFSIVSKTDGDIQHETKSFINKEMGLKDRLTDSQDDLMRISKSLYALRLFKVVSVFPLIYSSLLFLSEKCKEAEGDESKIKGEIKVWISMLKFFEIFLFSAGRISHSLSKHAGNFETIYSDYCKKFYNTDIDFVKEVQNLRNEVDTYKVSRNIFKEEFKKLSYDNKNDKEVIRYIFDKINSDGSRPNNTTSFLNLGGHNPPTHSIEHILSQENKENSDAIINSIGNLVVIHRDDNSSLGDDSPEDKVGIIKKWIKSGKISNNLPLQQFIDYYDKSTGDKKWGKELIEQRTENIADEIYDLMYPPDKQKNSPSP